MADTQANRRSGGPKVFWAKRGVALPSLAGTSITWSNNEVQTATEVGTVSGGTYTLTFLHPTTLVEETTAAIAYDADAATIKAALVALAGITTADITVTGGPISTTPVVFTFTGALANTPIRLLVCDYALVEGGGSISLAHTTLGRLWTQLPSAVNNPVAKSVETWEPFSPTQSRAAQTDMDLVKVGLESLELEFKATDYETLMSCLLETLTTTQAAGSSQAGYVTMAQPYESSDFIDIQIVLQYQGSAGGWGFLRYVPYAKRTTLPVIEPKDGAIRTTKWTVGIMGAPDSTIIAEDRCYVDYEYRAAPTS